MAVDTRQKRFSLMNMRNNALHGISVPLFEADGAIDADDRSHILGLYSGIGLSSVLGSLLVLPHGYRGGYHQSQGGFST